MQYLRVLFIWKEQMQHYGDGFLLKIIKISLRKTVNPELCVRG